MTVVGETLNDEGNQGQGAIETGGKSRHDPSRELEAIEDRLWYDVLAWMTNRIYSV